MTTIKLEDLHGRVMDVLGYEMLPHPHFAKVFGEPGRQYLEAYKEQFGGMWKAVVEADPPEIKEITLETVWTKKGKSAPSAHDLSRRPAVLDAMGIRRQLITPALILTALPASTGRTNMTPPPPSENVAVAISLLDAYNEWAVELTRKYSDRFRLPGVVPATALSVDELVKGTERLIASGIKLVAIPSRMPPAGLSPGDPALDPFYAALAKANVPL